MSDGFSTDARAPKNVTGWDALGLPSGANSGRQVSTSRQLLRSHRTISSREHVS